MRLFTNELKALKTLSHNAHVLLSSHLIFAFVLPVTELFIGTYILRKSADYSLIIIFQLSQGSGIPLTFILNNYLVRYLKVSILYGTGIVLTSVAMLLLMLLPELNLVGIIISGLAMGVANGFFWANRIFLTLKSTNDESRNYYYGLETLFFTSGAVIMPLLAGYFISLSKNLQWFNSALDISYLILAGFIFILALNSAINLRRASFENPESKNLLFFRFHQLWKYMLYMAVFKGVSQGFIVAAPVMLVMKFLGDEGAIGTIQAAGASVSAIILYAIGKRTGPDQRLMIFAAGVCVYLAGAFSNLLYFNAYSTVFFVGCLIFGRPLLDLAYFPIQLSVIECVSAKEKRSLLSYIFTHEVGLYMGRFFGCGLFILVARFVSDEAALRYTLMAIFSLQLFSIIFYKKILSHPDWCPSKHSQLIKKEILKEPSEIG